MEIDSILTDNPDSNAFDSLKADGINIVLLHPDTDMAAEAKNLKSRDVELLVVDAYDGNVPQAFQQAFGKAIVFPTSPAKAPLEVIEAETALRNQNAHIKKDTPRHKSSDPTPEEEWADALHVNYDPEEVARNEEAAIKQQTLNPTEDKSPTVDQTSVQPQPQSQQVSPGGGPQYFQAPGMEVKTENEPMPDTYLIWSVLITVFCCLIPGVIAIIYSASVSSKYYAGNIEGAKRASRRAQIWCIVSIIAGILWATFYLPLTLFMG